MGEVQQGSEAGLEQPRCSQCPWLGVEPAHVGLDPAGVMGALSSPKHVMWIIDFPRIEPHAFQFWLSNLFKLFLFKPSFGFLVEAFLIFLLKAKAKC